MKEYKFTKLRDLKNGENQHQQAGLYVSEDMADYSVLCERELRYDNILNLTCLSDVLSEFFDVNAVAISSNTNYCSVALGKTIEEAYSKAFDADPIGAYSGNVAFSQKISEDVIKHIISMNVQTVLAPDFDFKVAEFVAENNTPMCVKLNTPLQNFRRMCNEEVKITPFGTLIQTKNESELDKELFKVVTKTKPSTEQIEDAIFAWKIAKHTKTASAVVAKNFITLGIAQGQANWIDATEMALNMACDGSKDAVLALDGIVESQDIVFAAAQGRIGLIIQSGGSQKDNEIFKLADKYNIAMITTGIRNYKY